MHRAQSRDLYCLWHAHTAGCECHEQVAKHVYSSHPGRGVVLSAGTPGPLAGGKYSQAGQKWGVAEQGGRKLEGVGGKGP